MSQIVTAAAAIEECRRILNFNPEKARGWWNDRLNMDERRAYLRHVGQHLHYAASLWDALPEGVRESMRGQHDRAEARAGRLARQFGFVRAA